MFRLDSDRWRVLSGLLDEALELDGDARAAWLAALRHERPELAALVAPLLAAHDELLGSDFLESRIADGPGYPSLAGRTVGAYTLDIPLGIGGMGTVWRARRSDGRFEGFVAVKLLNLAVLDHQADERFKREGSLLARLSHPSIARLLDAGVTSTGQPYLVLEYVDGIPIDRFADDHRQDVNARIRLFLHVADAVAYAHANLIVHRDLKPSNILVTAGGRIKLLDFGIATLLQHDATDPTTLVGLATQALTPEYAAPEQLQGGPVTTATDVYALGVLLYGLLTGRRPAREGGDGAAHHLRALSDGGPVRPSDAVRGPAGSDAAACAARLGATPERLQRRYRGDIDNVLARTLEKSPERRYASVTALAEDLRRFLDHEPLSVHAPSWSYRAAKFARRHRWPVVLTVVVFAMLAAGLVVVNRERMLAERRFRQLRQLSQAVFALDKRIENLAGATEARQALVSASLTYLEGLSRDAGGDLDLLQEVSDGYWRVARIQGVPTGLTLGDFRKAEESLKNADVLLDTILLARPDDRRALERSALVASDRMILAESERRRGDAVTHARKAVDRMNALLSAGPPAREERESALSVYANAATACVNLHRYDEAIRYARRMHEVATAHGPAPRPASYALSVLANALRYQGDLDGALRAIREARQAAEQIDEKNESRRMFARYPLLLREALILGEDRAISLGRSDEAAVLFREAFEMNEAGARRDPNDFTSRARVGTTGLELGDILRWRDPEAALEAYGVALARLAEIRNNIAARRNRAVILASSAYALRQINRTAAARQRIDEALGILSDTKDRPADRIRLDSELCTVLQAAADQRAGEGHLGEAIGLYEQLLEKVVAARPDIEHDLRDAYRLSLLYQDLSTLHRRAGAEERAAAVEVKRRAIWNAWNQARPNNPFVLRQLEPPSPGDASRQP